MRRKIYVEYLSKDGKKVIRKYVTTHGFHIILGKISPKRIIRVIDFEGDDITVLAKKLAKIGKGKKRKRRKRR